MKQLIYENSAQKIGDILIQCVKKYHCSYAEVYRYSYFDNYIEGFLEIDKQLELRKPYERKDSLLGMPLLYLKLRHCEPVFLNARMLATSIPPKYNLSPDIKFVAVLPIHRNEVAIGLIALHFERELSELQQHELVRFAEYISQKIITSLSSSNVQNNFSKRELETMDLIAEGWTTQEIAELYSMSEATIKHYIKTFMQKSKTYNRSHAVGYYMKHFYLSK